MGSDPEDGVPVSGILRIGEALAQQPLCLLALCEKLNISSIFTHFLTPVLLFDVAQDNNRSNIVK